MSNVLQELRKLFGQAGLSKSDMINVMSQTRILIEENRLQSDYPYLNLYCNWCLHSKLKRSITCYRILEKITEILVNHNAPNARIHEVSNAISIPKLRKDFIGLFEKFQLPTVIFQDRNIWKSIFGIISSIILDRPIEFPSPKQLSKKHKVKAIYDSMHKIATGTDLAVRQFSFTTEGILAKQYFQRHPDDENTMVAAQFKKGSNTLYWKILAQKDFIEIVSPVVLLE